VGERRVGLDPRGEAAQHVGPVGEEGDGPEALGLALGAEPAAGHVEAHQRLVGRRVDLDLGGQHEGVGDLVDRQAFAVEAVFVGAQRLAVDGRRDQLQPLAVQEQRLARRAAAFDRQGRLDPRRAGFQLELQFGGLDQERERAIVREPDGLGRVCAHGAM
jgi:hypothetical protein